MNRDDLVAFLGITGATGRNDVVNSKAATLDNWQNVIPFKPLGAFATIGAATLIGGNDSLPLFTGEIGGCDQIAHSGPPAMVDTVNNLTSVVCGAVFECRLASTIGVTLTILPAFFPGPFWIGRALSFRGQASVRASLSASLPALILFFVFEAVRVLFAIPLVSLTLIMRRAQIFREAGATAIRDCAEACRGAWCGFKALPRQSLKFMSTRRAAIGLTLLFVGSAVAFLTLALLFLYVWPLAAQLFIRRASLANIWSFLVGSGAMLVVMPSTEPDGFVPLAAGRDATQAFWRRIKQPQARPVTFLGGVGGRSGLWCQGHDVKDSNEMTVHQ